MCFSLPRLCCLGAALLALPATAAEAQSDATAKAASATAVPRSPARAQVVKDAPKLAIEKPVSSQEQSREARLNNSVIGLAAGRPEDSFSSYAADLATVLDDSQGLRVLPMSSYGAAGNIIDLLYLNSVERRSRTSTSAFSTSCRCSMARFTCSCGRRSRRSGT